MIDAGITSFKIEGRLKTPEYVANTVRHYREAIDAALSGQPRKLSSISQRELEMSFSRGFTPGWLEGCNHKRLVPGNSSAKRGVFVGKVVAKRGERVTVDLLYPLAKGDGVVFEGNRAKGKEVGGRIYEVFIHGKSIEEAKAGRVEWMFERGLLKAVELHEGQKIWQTDDPRLTRKLKATYSATDPQFRRPVDMEVVARSGEKLRVTARLGGYRVEIESENPLATATKHPLNEELLREQLGRLGGTPFVLRSISADIQAIP